MKVGSYFLLVLSIILSGCSTYYQKNKSFQHHFENGQYQQAAEDLEENKYLSKERNQLLYLLEKAMVLHLLGQPERSNEKFEEAYIFTEDYRKNAGDEAIGILANPSVKPYLGEDHELVLIHYFKAINYLLLEDLDKALVECRRLNIRLNSLNDRYENKKNRYKDDAFAHNLMGMIYEASGDVNNAFIAYRNAYNSYEENYTHFNTPTPYQLKLDLLRTAHDMGFKEELEAYEKEFGMKYKPQVQGPELILFWQNGLGPVKEEWSINFAVVHRTGGVVLFVNNEIGLSFSFVLPNAADGSNGLDNIKFVRVAFPKYRERRPYYCNASVTLGNAEYQLEMGENITEIGKKTLEDRMIRELAIALLRLAIKQSAAFTVGQKNEGAGSLISLLGALSEKADTRNWQSLPHAIYYTRIPLDTGNNVVTIGLYNYRNEKISNQPISVNSNGKQSVFKVFNSLTQLKN